MIINEQTRNCFEYLQIQKIDKDKVYEPYPLVLSYFFSFIILILYNSINLSKYNMQNL